MSSGTYKMSTVKEYDEETPGHTNEMATTKTAGTKRTRPIEPTDHNASGDHADDVAPGAPIVFSGVPYT